MKTNTCKRFIVPALFTCGMLSLTTGIVAAVQETKAETPAQTPPESPKPTPGLPDDVFESSDTDEQIASLDETRCKEIALAWLALIDQGKYNASYIQLHPSAKSAISPNTWTQRLATLRSNFGKVSKRQQITDPDQMYSTLQLENEDELMSNARPDDTCITIQFETESTGQEGKTIETVTVHRRDDGSYKVGSYYLEHISPDPTQDK